MEQESLLGLYNFIMECSDKIHNEEIAMLESMDIDKCVSFGQKISQIPMETIPVDYMGKQIGIWESISQRIPELTEYFSEIYIRKDFLNAPSETVAVLDVNEVRALKPQYLKKFIDDCVNIIDRSIGAKTLELDIDIDTTKTNKMLTTLKKNMVETDCPTYMRTEKSISFNNRRVDEVTPTYIQGTILPFFRKNMEELEEMKKISASIELIAIEGATKLKGYASTMVRLANEGKIQNGEKSFQVLFACVSVFLDASKYLIGHALRKMFIYASNVKSYGNLKDILNGIFRNDNFIESVSTDRETFLSHIHDTRVELEKEIMESTGIGKNELRRDIKRSPFDSIQFRGLNTLLSGLKQDFEAIESATWDSELSMDNIRNSVSVNHSGYYRELPSIDVYTESELDEYECKVGILREMMYAEKFFEKYMDGLDLMIEKMDELGELITRNPYNMYPNTLRNEEEVIFLQEEVDEFRNIQDMTMHNYAERLSNIQEYLYGDTSHPTFESDGESYLEESMKANLDIQQFIQEKEVHDAYIMAYESVIRDTRLSDPIMFVEADQPTNTNQNDQNQGSNQNTQNNQNANNQKKEDTKPTVTDNQNSQDNNSNNQNDTDNKDENGEKKESSLEKILQKIIDFANNLKGKLNDSLKKLKPNLKWIEANEDALRNRSYNNVTVDILPYNTSVKYVELIDICTNTLKNDIKPDRIANGSTSEDKIEATFRSRLHLNAGGDTKLNEKLLINLKSNGAGLKTTPISNGRLKQEINVMIDYCKYYYGSFDGDMSSALDRLTDAVNTVKNNVNNLEKVNKAANLLAYLGTLTNNVCGTVADVARDRSNDYLKVLQSLVPKQKNTNNNSGAENNNNDQNQNTDNENNSESNSSQPTS